MVAGSLKEKAVLAALGVVAAYALTVVWWFTGCSKSWQETQKRRVRSEETYNREAKLISERAMWDERYEEEASLIPEVESGHGADTVWMRTIDEIAKSNNIFISERKPGKEEDAGDMRQVTVDIRWTGAVESLVKFMHELENTARGKFDVQSLSFSPGKQKGYMGGNMTLVSIFKRK